MAEQTTPDSRPIGTRAHAVRRLAVAVALALLAVAVLLGSLAPLAAISPVRAAAVPLATWDFETDSVGALPGGWAPAAGTWAVGQDASRVLQRTDASTTLKGVVAAGSASWTDYTVRVEARPGANNPGGMIQIMARYADANNHYGVLLQQGSQWYLGKKVAGVWVDLASGTRSYNAGWHTLTLSVQGSAISATVDGVTLATVTDATFAAGEIALAAKSTAAFDNVSVITAAVAPSPSPTPSPTPTASATPTPPPPGSASPHLSTISTAAGVVVRSLNGAEDGWQVYFNANAGGAITSLQEINGGTGLELMDQAIQHGLVQSYLQIGGQWYANQLQPGQVIIVRDTADQVGIRTVSTHPALKVTWAIDYTIWPNGAIAASLRIENASGKAIKLTTPQSVQVNMDGLLVTQYPDQAPTAWYAKGGVITAPVPRTTNPIEGDFFALTPVGSAPPSLGVFVDKLTPWSEAGVTNYGIAATYNERRVKVMWIGTLPTFAPGQVIPVSLVLDLRRGLTQSQSLSLDAGYRTPATPDVAGILASG